jgi:glucose-6-phosphate 1-dehydrogenase
MPNSLNRTSDAGRASAPTTLAPCAAVIFGGAGDLTHRKLLPALYNLVLDGQLPNNFAILGFAIDDLNDESFRNFARSGIEKFSRQPLTEDGWSKFAPLLHYSRGSFTESADYDGLKARLAELDAEHSAGGNRFFYYAIPPGLIDACSSGLAAAGLIAQPKLGAPFVRVVIEKPVGHDLASAVEINQTLAAHFAESQLFRIDHYLGKETVENLMVLRFANSIFEPLWTSRFIDHVQITVAEEEGVGTRASYYDGAGALRDMVQSHLIQVLCMIASEPPRTTGADSIRDAKLDVIRCLRPLSDDDIEKWVVRGQYSEGLVSGQPARAYLNEDGISKESATETFVAMRCWIDNWRWAGVPFYLRTGKRMPRRASEIAIYFKPVPRILYNSNPHAALQPNVMTIRIQPDEGLSLHIMSKIPGAQVKLAPVEVDFHYRSTSPEAYETLLRDVVAGDQTLFMRRDTVEAAWRFVQPVLDAWSDNVAAMPSYAAGSWGPLEAALMIAADGRAWRTF